MKKSEILKAAPSGKMTMETVNNKSVIKFDNGVVFTPEKPNVLWNKLLKMGFERHYNFSSDEFDGIAEAGRQGLKVYDFTILEA